jgi:enterochelin esterase-like enzyme
MYKKVSKGIISVVGVLLLIVLLMNGFNFSAIINQFYHPWIVVTEIHSESLKKNQNVSIYLPPGYEKGETYPVLYLLHGKDGNEKSWFNGFFGISAAHIDKTADHLIKEQKIKPMIIVSPMIDNSYGVNTSTKSTKVGDHNEGLYEDFIVKELIPYVDSHFSTIQNKSGRYIGGLSMGGFSALYLAFSHPDLFSKVGGHSAALRLDVNTGSGIGWLFANGRSRDDIDPLYLAEQAGNDGISVYLDHGDMDHAWLVEGNKVLYSKLQSKNMKVQYVSKSGGHDYTYWSSQTAPYLMFYAG